MTDRKSPREIVRAASAEYGEDTVIDWCIAFLTGEISGEEAYGAELPKLVAITGTDNPGGWSHPVDPVNYYWIRVWAARVFLYVWREDAVDALRSQSQTTRPGAFANTSPASPLNASSANSSTRWCRC